MTLDREKLEENQTQAKKETGRDKTVVCLLLLTRNDIKDYLVYAVSNH